MEGGGTIDQDNDELDRFLREIRNTGTNARIPHAEECGPTSAALETSLVCLDEEEGKSSTSGAFTSFYHSPRPEKHAVCTSFSGSLNNTGGPFDQKLHSNGNSELANSDYQMYPVSTHQVETDLPDDQSFTSAFVQLTCKDDVEVEPSAHASVKYDKISSSHSLTFGGRQNPHSLNQSIYGYSSMDMQTPTFNTLNRPNSACPKLEAYAPFTSINSINGSNLETNCLGENYSRVDLHELKRQKPESLLPPVGEQLQSLPVYSAPIPLAPEMHSFQSPLRVHVPGVEFTAAAYQPQCYLGGESPAYMSPSNYADSHLALQDERHYRMQQQYFYLQQLQNQRTECLPFQKSINAALESMNGSIMKPFFEMPPLHRMENVNRECYRMEHALPQELNQLDLSSLSRIPCQYNDLGFRESGEWCTLTNGHKQTFIDGITHSCEDIKGDQVFDKLGRPMFSESYVTRRRGLNCCHPINSNRKLLTNGQFNHPAVGNKSFRLIGQDSLGTLHCSDLRATSKAPLQKYTTVDQVVGRIYLLAKDQNGCRFLQRRFAEGTPEDVEKIFVEIICHIVELMTDSFGNYLVQKLLDVCNEQQRMQILNAVTRNSGELVRVSCDPHGTRVVQKLIETLRTPEQFSIIGSSLGPAIVPLIKNINGNHVAQHCLQYLLPEHREFLFDAAIFHCVEIATDRHGCCVLQKCISYSADKQKKQMVSEIASNALVLSQDPFGNYVVQYVVEKDPDAIPDVLEQLVGNFANLSMQKYSSHVVEKCLRFIGSDWHACIIQELIDDPKFVRILQDPYGNFVIQSALNACNGYPHNILLEAIKPHIPTLRHNPYGKKVLSSNGLKK